MTNHHKLLVWLNSQILPHESEVRAWLGKALNNSRDAEDIIQEAYCRLSALADPDGINNPRAYFFKIVRNVVIDELRRSKIVRIETKAEVEEPFLNQEYITPERVMLARHELQRLHELIEDLPPRCRRIFKMRKIDGLSQREIARQLGVSENMVENEASRGLKRILKKIAELEGDQPKKRMLDGGGRGRGRRRGQFRH